jgi:hypothetical protein
MCAIVANRTERILERNQEKFSNFIHSVKSFAQNIFNVGRVRVSFLVSFLYKEGLPSSCSLPLSIIFLNIH